MPRFLVGKVAPTIDESSKSVRMFEKVITFVGVLVNATAVLTGGVKNVAFSKIPTSGWSKYKP